MALRIEQEGDKIFAPLLDKWVDLTPQEKIRQEYLCSLVNEYGFSLLQMTQGQRLVGVNQLQGPAVADIVIWKNRKDKSQNAAPFIIVECKVDSLPVRQEDYFKGHNYAFMTGASFLVAANSLEKKIFRIVKESAFPLLEEVSTLPNQRIINDSKKIDKLFKQTQTFSRSDFVKLLFTCHNIIRNNDKLSPEAAFDEMSKILFIKIVYENREKSVFSKEKLQREREDYKEQNLPSSYRFCQFLFDSTQKKFRDISLFEANEKIRVRENSFESIIDKLSLYHLGATLDDVKGIAFEKFLGRTFRGELGQFFTPRTIVDFMVEILDPEEGELICDPCCGSGGFLIKAFQYVKSKIEQKICAEKERVIAQYYSTSYHKLGEDEKVKIDREVDAIYAELNGDLDIHKKGSRLRALSLESIFGVDANQRMSRTAKMNMIMHGADGYRGVYHHDGLLNIDGIFENRFDVILTNPPFGTRVDKSMKITEADQYQDEERIAQYRQLYGAIYDNALGQVKKNIGKPILSMFRTGAMTSLTEVLFIERCLNLLKPGGRMGIVLPEGVLNNKKLQRVRYFIEAKAKIVLITSLPKDVFVASGANIKPSVVFLRKFTLEEEAIYQKTKEEVSHTLTEQFAPTLSKIEDKLRSMTKKGPNQIKRQTIQKELRDKNSELSSAINKAVKSRLDYPIPLAMIKKAGISSTGAAIENELKPLIEEFRDYRKEYEPWANKS